MPSLVGLSPTYLVAAMNAYKSGLRRHDTMKALVAGLDEADISNIALFYSRQTPERAKSPATGNPAAGKAAAAPCAACHGEAGVSAGPAPSLAGQDAQYFVAAMRAYRDGSRTEPAMAGAAASVGEAGLPNLAAFYAGLRPQPPKLGQSPGPAGWAERCDRCHGVNGNSNDPRVPALAAQGADYLEKSLNDYRNGNRKSPAMAAMSTMLTGTDARMLAEHYARQSARAVVYVRLPGAQSPGRP
jgi:cytochrome c553